MLIPLLSLLLFLVGGYLVFRRVARTQTSRNPAMEKLRLAYVRGNLSDEEFEKRREKLGSEETQ